MLDRRGWRRSRPGRRLPVPFVVLTEGWAGERVLVRLVAAGGTVRCSGSVLSRPRRDPGAHLRRALRRGGVHDEAHGAVVQAEHLWLRNELDPSRFVDDLRAEGVRIVTLSRRHHGDRGLSRALCGPDVEVLPLEPQAADAGQVAVFAQDGERADEWFRELGTEVARVVFEDDLITPESRAATAQRLAAWLGLEPWAIVPDPELPTTDVLWQLVADPESLAAGLRELASHHDAGAHG